MNHLVELIFQEVNRLFILAFEDNAQRTSNKTLIILNDEIEDTIEIIKSLILVRCSGLLLKEVSEKIQNEAKNKDEDFLIRY